MLESDYCSLFGIRVVFNHFLLTHSIDGFISHGNWCKDYSFMARRTIFVFLSSPPPFRKKWKCSYVSRLFTISLYSQHCETDWLMLIFCDRLLFYRSTVTLYQLQLLYLMPQMLVFNGFTYSCPMKWLNQHTLCCHWIWFWESEKGEYQTTVRSCFAWYTHVLAPMQMMINCV